MFWQKPRIKKFSRKDDLHSLSFQCSVKDIEIFFIDKSEKFIEEKYCQLYYIYDKKLSIVIGFFTLSMGSIKYEKDIALEKLTQNIPGVLIGQLGIHKSYEGVGWGSNLIRAIILIVQKLSERIGCRILIVDANTTIQSLSFYKKRGFDFVDEILGNKILNKLWKREKPSYQTVKMYLDLKKIRK